MDLVSHLSRRWIWPSVVQDWRGAKPSWRAWPNKEKRERVEEREGGKDLLDAGRAQHRALPGLFRQSAR